MNGEAALEEEGEEFIPRRASSRPPFIPVSLHPFLLLPPAAPGPLCRRCAGQPRARCGAPGSVQRRTPLTRGSQPRKFPPLPFPPAPPCPGFCAGTKPRSVPPLGLVQVCCRQGQPAVGRRFPAAVTWQRELCRVPAGPAPLQRPPRNGRAPIPRALLRFPPSAVRCGGWRELQAAPWLQHGWLLSQNWELSFKMGICFAVCVWLGPSALGMPD